MKKYAVCDDQNGMLIGIAQGYGKAMATLGCRIFFGIFSNGLTPSQFKNSLLLSGEETDATVGQHSFE
jgi:hypothetical protein